MQVPDYYQHKLNNNKMVTKRVEVSHTCSCHNDDQGKRNEEISRHFELVCMFLYLTSCD